MSQSTIALEAAVAGVLVHLPKEEGVEPTRRQRLEIDKAFTRVMKIIAPRVRHFIRQYGLMAHYEDAGQACAIAVYRAIQAYDPDKAQFTTFVNWQIRGELQSLRFRLMTDQRPSAKKVDATTVSISSVAKGPEGEETTLEAVIEDENALKLTESAASDYLAGNATENLIDAYIDHLRKVAINQLKRRPRPKRVPAGAQPRSPFHGIEPEELEKLEQRLKRNREIVAQRLFDLGHGAPIELDAGVTKERVRQITKRAAKTMGEIASSDAKFGMMVEHGQPALPRAKPRQRLSGANGAPAMPTPRGQAMVVLPEMTRSSERRSLNDSFDLIALEAREAAVGAVAMQSVLRH
jgi:RNA polymerase sigma-32 factor